MSRHAQTHSELRGIHVMIVWHVCSATFRIGAGKSSLISNFFTRLRHYGGKYPWLIKGLSGLSRFRSVRGRLINGNPIIDRMSVILSRRYYRLWVYRNQVSGLFRILHFLHSADEVCRVDAFTVIGRRTVDHPAPLEVRF